MTGPFFFAPRGAAIPLGGTHDDHESLGCFPAAVRGSSAKHGGRVAARRIHCLGDVDKGAISENLGARRVDAIWDKKTVRVTAGPETKVREAAFETLGRVKTPPNAFPATDE